MVTPDGDRWLTEIARRLDRLQRVPQEVLAGIVLRDGLCMRAFAAEDAPELLGIDTADRELAWLLCVGCPVQDECLELELRLAGEDTAGVWGALNEDDRRALYPHWRERGERAEPLDGDEDADGGEWP